MDKDENKNGKLLWVQDLHTWFELRRWGFGRAGFVRAVDGVSFDLGQGEAVAFVGESGCGKTTLAKTILGLYKPTKGQVEFEGRRLDDMKTDALRWYRSQVGYVQQDPYGAPRSARCSPRSRIVSKSFKPGGKIPLGGLGAVKLVDRKARIGRNPATGEQIQIPAKRVVKCAVAKASKDAILGSK